MTNTAEQLYRNGLKGIDDLPESVPSVPGLGQDCGLVVSLNILSQLWVVPRAYASQQMRGLDEYAVDEMVRPDRGNSLRLSAVPALRRLPGSGP